MTRHTVSHNPLIVVEAIPNFDDDHTVNIRATRIYALPGDTPAVAIAKRNCTIVFEDDIPEVDADLTTTRLISATRVLAATIRRKSR